MCNGVAGQSERQSTDIGHSFYLKTFEKGTASALPLIFHVSIRWFEVNHVSPRYGKYGA